MITQQHLDALKDDGVSVVQGVLPPSLILELTHELSEAITQDALSYPDVFDKGMVHNCMTRGAKMAEILDNPLMNEFLERAFSPTCILYAYQSSSLQPNQGNYGSRVHVDCPRFIPNYDTNMGVMFPLTDFTLDNGATFFLRGSHRNPELPTDEYFYKNAERVLCSAGDMILLNTRLVHAAGFNNTQEIRHSLTLNFCRSYMRQRFDFPRLVHPQLIESLGDKGKRLLGMNVRMPTKLSEFYLPPGERLYKPNQE
jgi:ectoine hydroxylase-related dioxygenase (phytanoyl-CoA dioxygenase family)